MAPQPFSQTRTRLAAIGMARKAPKAFASAFKIQAATMSFSAMAPGLDSNLKTVADIMTGLTKDYAQLRVDN